MIEAAAFRSAIAEVNKKGFAAIDLHMTLPDELGLGLYRAMDREVFHPRRDTYYNELTFFWPEDWTDVEGGLCAFHEPTTLQHILPVDQARNLISEKMGERFVAPIISFASQVRDLVCRNHFGLGNNELRLARVMLRQMNEQAHTRHNGSHWHEDQGYTGRPYQQLLSVIITTHGIPTEAEKHRAKVGELLKLAHCDVVKGLGVRG